MDTPTHRRTLLAAGAIVAAAVAAFPATAAPPKPKPQSPPSAVSQYVEQIPTARGSKATDAHSAQSPATTTSPTSDGTTTQPDASAPSTSQGTKSPKTTKANAAPSAASKEPSPLHAAVGATGDGGGLGRGAVLAIVLGIVTLIAALGFVLRARFRQ
jgi:hypothetical protein